MVGTWKLLNTSTTGTGSTTISSGTFTASDYLRIIIYYHGIGEANPQVRFNNDSNSSNYYNTYRVSNSSNSTGNTQSSKFISYSANGTPQGFMQIQVMNLDNEEKLVTASNCEKPDTNASSAPNYIQWVGKYTVKSGQVTEVSLTSNGSNFGSESYISVYGASDDVTTDEKTTLTNVPTGTQYRETDTRKIYRRVSSETIWQQNATLNGGEQTVNQSGWQNYNAFKVPSSLAGKKVKSVVVKCWGQGGDQSPSGTISAHIYNGTTKKAESDTINTSTLATGSNIWDSATTCTFTGGTLSDYTLQTDDYVAVVGNTARTGGGYIQTASSDSQGSGTNRWYRTGGGSWTEDTNNTMYMTVTSTDDWKERGTA
mgnify:CR=1 FL=1